MKVGKEGILGLTQAIESYITLPKTTGQEMVDKMTPFIASLNDINGVSGRVVWDSAGRDIARTEITFDEAVLGWKTKAIVERHEERRYRHLFPWLSRQRRQDRSRCAQRDAAAARHRCRAF